MRGMTVTMFNKHVENCHTAVGRLLFAWVTVVLRRCMVPHDQRFRRTYTNRTQIKTSASEQGGRFACNPAACSWEYSLRCGTPSRQCM